MGGGDLAVAGVDSQQAHGLGRIVEPVTDHAGIVMQWHRQDMFLPWKAEGR